MSRVTIPGTEFAELSADILRRGTCLRFEAHGQSMAPFIRDGDVLTIAPAPAVALRRAEVAFYRTGAGRMAAHRVIGRRVQDGQVVLLTRGDAVLGPAERVPAGQVLGRVVSLHRGEKEVSLDQGGHRLVPLLWVRSFPLGPILLQLARAGRQGALGLLQRLQALKPYRLLAGAAIGRRVAYRPATAADASALARLYCPARLAEMAAPTEIVARQLEQRRDCGATWVASVGGTIAGAAIATPAPEQAHLYPDWWLFGPLVRTRYRGAGIGEGLVRLALEKAAAEGACRVYLRVPEKDRPAIRLFRGLGFRPASLPALEEQGQTPGESRWILLARSMGAGTQDAQTSG